MDTQIKTKEITPKNTMQEILEIYPSAQRILFTRYHIGGCSDCGFQPTDTLEAVLTAKNVLDLDEAVRIIKDSAEAEAKFQISPSELAGLLKAGKVKLLDIRTEAERRIANIEGDQAVSPELVAEIKKSWPKETAMVLYCHDGQKSVDAAAYLIGHGLGNVKSLRGGIDAWSSEIDPLLPRY